MNNKANIGIIVLIIMGSLIVIWLILNNIYTTYLQKELGNEYSCINGKPSYNGMTFLPSLNNPETVCNNYCGGYGKYSNVWVYKVKNIVICRDNQPICECKSTIWSRYIKGLF